MKKIIYVFVILLVVAVTLPSCGKRRGPAPEMEKVYDRLVEVIEKSHEINVLLFGVGLPTYPRGDAEDELIHRYYGVNDVSREYVTPYAKFAMIEQMKEAIAEVYGSDYRESMMASVFTGFVDTGISSGLPARYTEDENSVYQYAYLDPLVTGVRVYDYASMQIVEEDSYDSYIRVSIRSYADNRPGEWTTVYLSFVYENGNWYLNSPSC